VQAVQCIERESLQSTVRIAITVDPYIPVPPREYGGIERVADIVVRGLVNRGHDVTLFAHSKSRTGGQLVPYGTPPHSDWRSRLTELADLGGELWKRRNQFDVVFSWGRMAALLPLLPYRQLPKVQRYCRNAVPWRSVRMAVRLAGNSIRFAGASSSVYDERPAQGPYGGIWYTQYDGIDLRNYTFSNYVASDAPLVFLGRIERVKGPHTAIQIARLAGKRLIIAGNTIPHGEAATYFEQQIRPYIDGQNVTFAGPVDDSEKNKLLGSAAALLFPIEWKEAFGIVMAESFACGTPVIGFRCGSVPEVIRDGVNGYVCRDVNEAVTALSRIRQIDRAVVRTDCEARFSDTALVNGVERILNDAITGAVPN
jgi:glycosyltransferase involved in cell wall biosynthesis